MLAEKALANSDHCKLLAIAKDGVEALAFLRQEDEYKDAARPDLILLDLNMPRMDGREALKKLKADKVLRCIPVVVLTTSDSEKDILDSYSLKTSCYVTKPDNMEQFAEVLHALMKYWQGVVQHPS
jgi:two-component system response regulator